MISFLKSRADTFAWSTNDLLGIDPSVAKHRLNISPRVKPQRQKMRIQSQEKREAMAKECLRLKLAGHIIELAYTKWVCNPVMVEKKTEGPDKVWRMCIDYTDLNRVTPKDPFPLPNIDHLVDSTAGCGLLSLMDASQGYY